MNIVREAFDGAVDLIAAPSLKVWAAIVSVLIGAFAVWSAATVIKGAFDVGRSIDRVVLAQAGSSFETAR